MVNSKVIRIFFSFVLAVAVTFVLSINVAVEDALAHPCKHHEDPDHDHCTDDTGGGGNDGGGGSSTEPTTCTDEYMGGVSGICMDTCFFDTGEACPSDNVAGECILLPPSDNTPGWHMAGSCRTTGTLVLSGERPILSGDGHTLYLDADQDGNWNVDPNTGLGRENIPRPYAAITNGGHTLRVASMTIEATDSRIADGCAGALKTAVSLDPDRTANPALPRIGAAFLEVGASGGAKFCNALEYVGSNPYDRFPYFSGGISGNVIQPDVYANAAIRVANINNTDNLSGKDYDAASIGDNVIEYSASGCVGILVEDVERAHIEGNTVTPPGGGDAGCVGDGVGISIIKTGVSSASFQFDEPRPVKLSDNAVTTQGTNAIGVRIEDSEVDPNAKNQFAGDPGDFPYSISGTGNTDFPTKGKARNRCNGEPILAVDDPCI